MIGLLLRALARLDRYAAERAAPAHIAAFRPCCDCCVCTGQHRDPCDIHPEET